MDVGLFFIDFLPQHGMPEVAKIVDSSTFLIFWLLGYLGLFFDRFLIDLGSKIDAKLIKNRSRNRSKIRCDLGSIFDGSWVGFGVDLGAKLGPKIDQNRSQERSEM